MAQGFRYVCDKCDHAIVLWVSFCEQCLSILVEFRARRCVCLPVVDDLSRMTILIP